LKGEKNESKEVSSQAMYIVCRAHICLVDDVLSDRLLLGKICGLPHPHILVVQIEESACARRFGCLTRLFTQVYLDKHDGRAHDEKDPWVSDTEVFVFYYGKTLLE
jgi:hypothetical protein